MPVLKICTGGCSSGDCFVIVLTNFKRTGPCTTLAAYYYHMIQFGQFNKLKVLRINDAGAYLDDGDKGILLPKRFMPRNTKLGAELDVFLYHDSEDRPIATTQTPKAVVNEIAFLECVGVTGQGAFLDWGLMKDLFVPRSKQLMGMRVGGQYLVKLYIDEQTGRIAATEKIEQLLTNEALTVKEKDPVQLIIYRRTDLGYAVIINNLHNGLLHSNEVFQKIQIGQKLEGFIKTVRPDNKIDVSIGKAGYQRVEGETEKIIRLLQENDGYLPYHDKSEPEAIYDFFGMSKKAFKMALGKLYKERKVELTQTGFKATEGA